MTIELTPLPFKEDALAPAISAETLRTHHGKHHKAYVDKTNAAIEGTALAGASLEQVIHAAEAAGDTGLFNNAGQAWNHGFYWHSLSAAGPSLSGPLRDAIEAAFGSVEDLKEELASQGAAHFASGWVWLADNGGTLEVVQTHDAGTLATAPLNPLLVIDLWEHAYYLDHKNLRPDYLRQVIDRHLDWDFAAANLARGTTWTYPG